MVEYDDMPALIPALMPALIPALISHQYSLKGLEEIYDNINGGGDGDQLFECYFIDSNEERKIKWNYNHIAPAELHGLFPEANGQVAIEKESERGIIITGAVLQNGIMYIVPVPHGNSEQDSEIPELLPVD